MILQTLAVIPALICAEPKVEGVDLNNKHHVAVLKEAEKGCKERFPRSPCLAKLTYYPNINHFEVVCRESIKQEVR